MYKIDIYIYIGISPQYMYQYTRHICINTINTLDADRSRGVGVGDTARTISVLVYKGYTLSAISLDNILMEYKELQIQNCF